MIESEFYIFPLEEIATEQLRNAMKFEKELASYYVNYTEKMLLPDLLGKTVKVSKLQFPEFYKLAESVCDFLGLTVPPIYVYEDFYYGIESHGISSPWIEISAKTLEDFTSDELVFLLAKELCDIELKHTYYNELIQCTRKNLHTKLNIIGAKALEQSDIFPMMKWSRIANYTSDCFGYLVCNHLTVCIRTILKLVLNSSFLAQKVNIPEFISQARDINLLNDDAYNNSKLDELTPYAALRIKNLISYAASYRGLSTVSQIQSKGE